MNGEQTFIAHTHTIISRGCNLRNRLSTLYVNSWATMEFQRDQ